MTYCSIFDVFVVESRTVFDVRTYVHTYILPCEVSADSFLCA